MTINYILKCKLLNDIAHSEINNLTYTGYLRFPPPPNVQVCDATDDASSA